MGHDIAERVQQIVAEQLGIPRAEVTTSASFAELGADSLAVVELLLAVEEAFDLEITDADTLQLRTVGDAIGHVMTVRRREAQ